jgi:hypothetical protein
MQASARKDRKGTGVSLTVGDIVSTLTDLLGVEVSDIVTCSSLRNFSKQRKVSQTELKLLSEQLSEIFDEFGPAFFDLITLEKEVEQLGYLGNEADFSQIGGPLDADLGLIDNLRLKLAPVTAGPRRRT